MPAFISVISAITTPPNKILLLRPGYMKQPCRAPPFAAVKKQEDAQALIYLMKIIKGNPHRWWVRVRGWWGKRQFQP